jgi:hypothetical protein
MTDQHLDWLKEQPAAILLLEAYARLEAALPRRPSKLGKAEPLPTAPEPTADNDSAEEADDAECWIPRLKSLEGVDPDVVSQLHGGLIARGLLKFEVFGRQLGMRYRLTPDGRKAAESAPAAAAAA